MTTKLKLGSLFDGSGGFPLAGSLHGIEPVWASEIEPFPIRVTKLRFPSMKHLGNVTEINGAEIEPVDIITFGSPCQDLSVAGKQKGIHDGERSNLFFEAVRIIREMREHDRAIGRADVDIRPRFAVWENVPGAFSSNHGADFQAVLQALCEIDGGCGVSIPMPAQNKWFPAGCVVGDGYSVARRVYDAQFWGVPQRRKRIYLIADFGSERAGEILFERESVSGNPQTSGEARERAADDAERGIGGSDNACGCDLYNGQLTGDKAATLGANSGASANHAGPSICYKADGVKCLNPWDCQSKRQYSVNGVYRTLDAGNCAGGQAHGVVYPINTMVATRGGKDDMRTCFGIGKPNDPQFTLSAAHEHAVAFQLAGDRNNPSVSTSDKAYCIPANPMSDRGQAVCFRKSSKPGADGKGEKWVEDETANTLNGFEFHSDVRTPEIVCYEGQNVCCDSKKAFTLQSGRPDQQHIPSVVYRQDGFAGYSEGVGTLKASGGDIGGAASSLSVFENHSQDSRYTGPVDVSQTVSATFGMGGNNQPFVVERKSDE